MLYEIPLCPPFVKGDIGEKFVKGETGGGFYKGENRERGFIKGENERRGSEKREMGSGICKEEKQKESFIGSGR